MEYVRLGRKLGIGTRIVAKVLRDRAQNAASPAANTAPVPAQSTALPEHRTAPHKEQRPARKQIDTRAVTRNLTRGAVRGGQGFWKPFARNVHALWHEITGVFFALFALFFIQNTWRVRDAWRSGPEHRHFAVYLLLALLFAYFSITAFVTSRHHKR